MGIDIHGLHFLQYSFAKSNSFGDVATVGRQQIFLTDKLLSGRINLRSKPRYLDFCEKLVLEDFQATSVVSFDASEYEGATYIADFNDPLIHNEVYDTVIDFGTIEHIFDIAQALRNIDQLCKPGGQILHLLPANNYCGHGFWQFSPELFFSIYSAKNGYGETEVFVMEESNSKIWYKVRKPDGNRRINLKSDAPVIVTCRTVKLENVTEKSVQQSDYAYIWEHANTIHIAPPKEKSFLKQRTKLIAKKWKSLLPFKMKNKKEALSARNVNLTAHNVQDLIVGTN